LLSALHVEFQERNVRAFRVNLVAFEDAFEESSAASAACKFAREARSSKVKFENPASDRHPREELLHDAAGSAISHSSFEERASRANLQAAEPRSILKSIPRTQQG